MGLLNDSRKMPILNEIKNRKNPEIYRVYLSEYSVFYYVI